MIRSAFQRVSGRRIGIQPLPCALLVVVGLSAQSVLAQPFRTQVAPPSVPSLDAQQAFQMRIDDQARLLANDRRFRRLSQHKRQALVEFVVGNVLIVAMHQLGLALLSELSLPAIGGADQAADDFAVLTILELGKRDFSDRILMEAAKGWFSSMRRKQVATDKSRRASDASVRRAYRMACMMVGADAVRFKALTEEIALPKNLQRNCGWDYETALRSWDVILRPRRARADQLKTQIDVSYGIASGNLALYAEIFRNLRFLETIAEGIASQVTWSAPLLMEMRKCDAIATTWNASTRTLSVCYEMADDFAELYRGFEQKRR
jgi:hypothetical protein